MSDTRLLLCCDLDRTLLPNGAQSESPGAREAFALLAARPEVTLVYVTGRDLELMRAGLAEYGLPQPYVAVTDVGTSITERDGESWRPWHDWQQHLATDWPGHDQRSVRALFDDLAELRPQAAERQADFKLSYDVSAVEPPGALLEEMRDRLSGRGLRAQLVFSVDEHAGHGLLDVLPSCAGKRHALEHVRRRFDLGLQRVLYAGDSGNDLDVLVSEIPSVLVANASESVRRAALLGAREGGHLSRLYLARGGHRGMNGHYAAGVLEGVQHFHPALLDAALEAHTP